MVCFIQAKHTNCSHVLAAFIPRAYINFARASRQIRSSRMLSICINLVRWIKVLWGTTFHHCWVIYAYTPNLPKSFNHWPTFLHREQQLLVYLRIERSTFTYDLTTKPNILRFLEYNTPRICLFRSWQCVFVFSNPHPNKTGSHVVGDTAFGDMMQNKPGWPH